MIFANVYLCNLINNKIVILFSFWSIVNHSEAEISVTICAILYSYKSTDINSFMSDSRQEIQNGQPYLGINKLPPHPKGTPPYLLARPTEGKARSAEVRHSPTEKKIEIAEFFPPLSELFPRSAHKKPRRAEVFSSHSELFHPLSELFWRTAEVKPPPA